MEKESLFLNNKESIIAPETLNKIKADLLLEKESVVEKIKHYFTSR